MDIKTVPHRPYSPGLAPCDFWLFPKLRGCRYETIEEMKEAVTKVIDTLTQEDFHGAFQKLLVRYNKCLAAGGDYFEGDLSFICVSSIKVPIRKKSGNLFNDPCMICKNIVDNILKRAWVAFFGIQLNGFKYCYITIFTNPSTRAGHDTWSIFKRSLTGLNSEFSFS